MLHCYKWGLPGTTFGSNGGSGMRWFRSHIRSGAWLALCALALQLALTFAHVHPLAIAKAAAQIAAQDDPSSPEPAGPIVDHCAICTVSHMAGTMVPPVAPALVVPFATSDARLAISIDRPRAAAPPRTFQARAPPIA
jgi:hypothetical protein